MKITLGLLDERWDTVGTASLDISPQGDGCYELTDVAVELPLGTRRYVFVRLEGCPGKMSLSIRRQPLLGSTEFYGQLIEFEFFADLKRLPVACTGRLQQGQFLKIVVEE